MKVKTVILAADNMKLALDAATKKWEIPTADC